MSGLPDIAKLEDLLFKVDAAMGGVESHGALCGMLCAQGSTEASQWLVHVLGEQESSDALTQVAAELMQIYQVAIEQMNDSNVDLELFLPADEDPLEERVIALGSWCQGFVYGLAAGGVKEDTELPGDTQELIRDIIEISRIGHESLEDDDSADSHEQDEVAFMELMEYVRMGTLLIYEELQPLQSSQTVH